LLGKAALDDLVDDRAWICNFNGFPPLRKVAR
jgi:hypothetical protein